MKLNEKQFRVLSYTWGLPLTLVGTIVGAAMKATGHEEKQYGWCKYYEVGEHWGGCEFGPVFLKCKEDSQYLCDHEYGHAIQNCMYGPLMPFVVNLPSSVRYWYRRAKEASGNPPKSEYDAVWFERQATKLGRKYIK